MSVIFVLFYVCMVLLMWTGRMLDGDRVINCSMQMIMQTNHHCLHVR